MTVEATAFAALGREQRSALEQAAARFAAFLELEGDLVLTVL